LNKQSSRREQKKGAGERKNTIYKGESSKGSISQNGENLQKQARRKDELKRNMPNNSTKEWGGVVTSFLTMPKGTHSTGLKIEKGGGAQKEKKKGKAYSRERSRNTAFTNVQSLEGENYFRGGQGH